MTNFKHINVVRKYREFNKTSFLKIKNQYFASKQN